MSNGFFITGTDTEVGKTYVAVELMRALREKGQRVIGFKPVAAGAGEINGVLKNSDACQLLESSSVKSPYGLINPYCFELAIAPHIAAEESGDKIELDKIQSNYQQLKEVGDIVIVEGAGGWLTPLNNEEGMDEIVGRLGLSVILVVGLKLGCINHALLTEAAIKQKGYSIVGWVANGLEQNFEAKEQNIIALKARLGSPCLGVLDFRPNGRNMHVAEQINTQLLLDYLVDFS